MRVVLVLVLVVLFVAGVKQSQLLVLRLSLEFDNIQHLDLSDIKHNHIIDQPFLDPIVFQYKISFTQMCVLEWILSTEEKSRNAQAVTGSKPS